MTFFYSLPFLLLFSLVGIGIGYWRIHPGHRPPLAIMGLRWFLGVLFLFSGLAKIIPGFPNTMGPPDLESTLAVYNLGLYARFVAVTEVGVGLLLVTRRFAALGALLLAPLLLNVLVVTTALEWRGTPYVVSVFLLMDLILLAYDRSYWLPMILGHAAAGPVTTARDRWSRVMWLALLILLLGMLGALRFSAESPPGIVFTGLAVVGLAALDWRQSRDGH